MSIAFGPVPSRRLGRSLGINNIPAKTCSYSCIYCQLGNTTRMKIDRHSFYEPELIFKDVDAKVALTKSMGEPIDYLTFVPDGEPTLDVALSEELALLEALGIQIAVISNASLLKGEDVRDDLAEADLVSLKIDAVDEKVWSRIDRPHRFLKLDEILEGIRKFAKEFPGKIITETMLVSGVNDGQEEIMGIAEFLSTLKPEKAYVAVPTRPPAEKWVKPASESIVNMTYQAFSEALGSDRTEYLVGYEGDAFASTGNSKTDLLSIVSVHPMREDAVEELLNKGNADWSIVESLIQEEKLVELEYEGRRFYIRKFSSFRS
jgi:wyosine [tRNA(Phe)-imidazoG37] synthetase (radical SAM superfamily)